MWIAIIAIVVIIALFLIVTYNSLVQLKQKVKNAWSQIEVQLQRRFDLVPNLTECVKGYMAHEKDVLEKVTELRSSWANAKSIDEKVDLDNKLQNTLKTIMAVSENYPDLKANENFISLQNSLSEIEDKVSYARQFYNDAVTMYNTKIAVFPNNIVASLFGFKPENLFNVDNAEARNAVKVDFNK